MPGWRRRNGWNWINQVLEDDMSIWTHFTGGFGLDGVIFDQKRWKNIENEISLLISPLPDSDDRLTVCNIKLHEQDCLHFADIFVSSDIRYLESLDPIKTWLLRIQKGLDEKAWWIRCGCFYAFVEGQSPVIYYYDDQELIWRMIKNVKGDIL
jgi:hypothetical protein